MDLSRRLRSRGYRVTPQREVVFGILKSNQGNPLSPEEIHCEAARKRPQIGLSTVYRTLELFCELGVAFPVHLRRGYRFYELNTGKHHHHMECLSCGAVESIEACMIEEIMELVRDGSDFLVTSHCMSLFGYCQDCIAGGRVGGG